MPLVENRVIIKNVSLDAVWQVMCDFETFPRLLHDVLDVSCFDRKGYTLKST